MKYSTCRAGILLPINKQPMTSQRWVYSYHFWRHTDFGKCPTYFEIYLKPSSYSVNGYGICPPGREYQSAEIFRHKDSLGRVWTGPEDDRYLSATDGRLASLIVQASEEIRDGPANSTWPRKAMEPCTPTILQVVYGLLGPQLQNDPDASWFAVCLWWLPSCLTIAALVRWPPGHVHDISDII